MISDTCDYQPEEWDRLKPIIYQLYIVENEDFKSMRQHLAQDYRFSPTKNKLLTMLKLWGFKKYSNGEKWRALPAELKRKGVSLERLDEVELDGRMVSTKKLKKEMARHGAALKVLEECPFSPEIILSPPSTITIANRISTAPELPLFCLLQSIVELAPTYSSPLFTEPSSSEALLRLYKRVRLLLLETAFSPSDCPAEQPCQNIIRKASTSLFQILEVGEQVRRHLGPHDACWCLEAVLPNFSLTTDTNCIDLIYSTSVSGLDNIATCFCLCYLRLNFLVETEIFDEFVGWAYKIDEVKASVTAAALSTHCVSKCLRTELLHAAIRLKKRQWALELLNIGEDQVSLNKVPQDHDDSYDIQKATPLQAAILAEDVQMAELFIEAGVDINTIHPQNNQVSDSDLFLRDPPSLLAVRKSSTLSLLPSMLQRGAAVDESAMIPQAILAGATWETVSALVDAGANLRGHMATASGNVTALHAACKMGNCFLVNKLLELGLNPEGHSCFQCSGEDCPNKPLGPSPLVSAVEHNAMDAIHILLDYGAKVDLATLTAAVVAKSVDLLLCLACSNMDESLLQDRSLLDMTIRNQDIEMLEILLGLQRGLLPKTYQEVLFEAAQTGSMDVLAFVVQKLNNEWILDHPLIAFEQALLLASKNGQIEAMAFLIKLGAGINAVSVYTRETVVEAAVRNAKWAAAAFAVENGAVLHFDDPTNPPCRQRRLDILLTLAAVNNQYAGIMSLLENGASPNGDPRLNTRVRSPIINAIRNGNMHILRLLLKHGVKADHRDQFHDDRGRDPLLPTECAVFENQPEAVQIISTFDKPYFRGGVADQFWLLAVQEDLRIDKRIVDFLIHMNLWENHYRPYVLTWAFRQEYDSDSLADMLIRNGAAINSPTPGRMTPLQSAIMNRRFELARRLIRERADVNAKAGRYVTDRHMDRVTALQAACHQGHVDTVKSLLKRRADLDASSRHGRSALQISAEKGFLGIVKTLLDAGADVKITSDTRGTAVEAAAANGRVDVLKLLLDNYRDQASVHHAYEAARIKASEQHEVGVLRFLDEYAVTLRLAP